MSSPDPEYLKWEATVGSIVPKRVSPGFVVLSYAISYIGALTTLELINRRTATKGLLNWFILISSAISMGGISVWCMHFIGNRAFILGDSATIGQIAYSPGYTGLSFFVPVLVLSLAFWAVGHDENVNILRVALGGVMVGFGVCGMHYLGQAGIINYVCIYSIGHIVGAAAIAVIASIGALGIFFRWRSTWAASFWRRSICAAILAGAVSGMHWIASVGTQYRLKSSDHIPNAISRNSIVIVVIVLSVGSCLLFLGLIIVAQYRRRLAANRAQKVALAAAYFDPDGRLMVSPEGLLPSTQITDTYIERSFEDVFDTSHPVFLWIYRTSHYWEGVIKLLPGMRAHVPNAVRRTSNAGNGGIRLINDQGALVEDYTIIFKELFCIAAANLAEQINRSLDDVGVLFPAIISTGRKSTNKASKHNTPASSVDIEREGVSVPVLGSGQLLFLVNSVTRREAEQLQAAGWRFAIPRNVIPVVARSIQVSQADLQRYIGNMSRLAESPPILEPGIHLACFSIRAAVSSGFDILVRKDAVNQLPAIRLPYNNLEGWQLDFIRRMHNRNVTQCLKYLNDFIQAAPHPKEKGFATQFLSALERLGDEIGAPIFDDALLISRPFQVPCRAASEASPPDEASIIAFRSITPIHTNITGKNLEFIPLTLFKALQHVYRNSPDHAAFARKTYREISPILDAAARQATTSDLRPSTANIFHRRDRSIRDRDSEERKSNRTPSLPTYPPLARFWSRNHHSSADDGHVLVKPDNSSEKNLVQTISQEQHPFGGILVSQDVNVDVRGFPDTVDGQSGGGSGSSTPLPVNGGDGKGRAQRRRSIELVDLKLGKIGVVTLATKEVEVNETFVDKLLSVCIESR